MLIRMSLLSVFVLGVVGLVRADGLDHAEFTRLHKMLQPAKDEPWRTIPWKISVLDAQKASIAEKKPIFIWAMDGHPLGCT